MKEFKETDGLNNHRALWCTDFSLASKANFNAAVKIF